MPGSIWVVAVVDMIVLWESWRPLKNGRSYISTSYYLPLCRFKLEFAAQGYKWQPEWMGRRMSVIVSRFTKIVSHPWKNRISLYLHHKTHILMGLARRVINLRQCGMRAAFDRLLSIMGRRICIRDRLVIALTCTALQPRGSTSTILGSTSCIKLWWDGTLFSKRMNPKYDPKTGVDKVDNYQSGDSRLAAM